MLLNFHHFILVFLSISAFAQDSLPYFKPSIRLNQTFSYIEDYIPEFSKENYQPVLVSLHFSPRWGVGFNYTPIQASGNLYNENYRMFGPSVIWHVHEKIWKRPSGQQTSFYSSLEIGYLKSDFLITETKPLKKETDYVIHGGNIGFHFYRQFFINFGSGFTFLIKKDAEALNRNVFYYRFGLGYKINLNKRGQRDKLNRVI